jgi:ketosteroid isomerase-like protein
MTLTVLPKATLLALALGCASGGAEFTADDEAAIRQLHDDLAAALTPEDNDAWSQLFTEDVQFMFGATPTIRGRGPLREWGETGSPVALSASFSDIEIQGSGDWAWSTSNYVVTVEGIDEPIPGKQLVVLERQPDGHWLMAAAHASASIPLPGN